MWYRLWTEYGNRIQVEVVDENIREFFRKWEKLMQEEASADPDGFHFNAHPLDKIYMDAFLDNISEYLRTDRATPPEGLNDYEQYEAEIAEANRLGLSTRAVKIKWARFMDDHIGEVFRFQEDWWGVFTNTTNMLP
ncbi:hypothetical protein, partial [Paramagnetospirillum caucaseum]|uniref:hypothetical protein n=1 Tax=Paramagnetospirillum caucaseum TaxID=1244869 RepID=UPI0012692691